MEIVPADAAATLAARVFDPDVGPCVAAVRGDTVVDLSAVEPTMSHLLDRADALDILREAPGGARWSTEMLLANTLRQDGPGPRFVAPVDLQVIKAAGVTFVRSMLERVIEERAAGDPARAADVRRKLADVVGDAINQIRPGSEQAATVKRVLVSEGLWSQYLEVGIGPDPEIFTKAPVL